MCAYTCILVYMCMCAQMQTRMLVHICMNACACAHIGVYLYAYTCICAQMETRIFVHIYIIHICAETGSA